MQPVDLNAEDRQRLVSAQWAPTVGPFMAFGRSWSIQTDDPDLAALVADLYADVATENTGDVAHATFRVITRDRNPRNLVARDDLRLGGGSAPSTAMGALVWGVNRWVLDEASRDHLLLHAGGVVRGDGVAVALPAPSESGKSTLTAALIGRGFAYLSDEALALNTDGTIQGYAKPISIDRGAWGILWNLRPDPTEPGAAYLEQQWHIRASRISRTAATGHLRAVIFPAYNASATTSLQALEPVEALLLASRSTFAAGDCRTLQATQIRKLAACLSGTPCFRLTLSDLDDASEAVVAALTSLTSD